MLPYSKLAGSGIYLCTKCAKLTQQKIPNTDPDYILAHPDEYSIVITDLVCTPHGHKLCKHRVHLTHDGHSVTALMIATDIDELYKHHNVSAPSHISEAVVAWMKYLNRVSPRGGCVC